MTEPRIRTSTVLEALIAVNDRLESLDLPLSSQTAKPPTVYFLGFWTSMTEEWVQLVGKVSEDLLRHAGSGPSTREEEYVLLIRCGTVVRGATGPQAIARLREITDVVEIAFRNQASGQCLPPDLSGAEIVRGGIERIEVDGGMTDTGAGAVADIYLRVFARI